MNLDKTLTKEYQETLQKYEQLLQTIQAQSKQFVERTSPSNPYLNKNIQFKNGQMAYVTNQGIVKIYNGSGDTVSKPISIALDFSQDWTTGQEIPGITPPLILGTPMVSNQSRGLEGSMVYVDQILPQTNLALNPDYVGCYSVPSAATSESTNLTWEQCKQWAINKNMQFFGLQQMDSNTNTGQCVIVNTRAHATELGKSMVPSKRISLWTTTLTGLSSSNIVAGLNDTGSLCVYSDQQVVYSTPSNSATPSNYLGCYTDKNPRAMDLYDNGNHKYDLQQCQDIAAKEGADFFALQDSSTGTGAQCALSNTWSNATQYGLATNCTKITAGSWSGGGWSNALYNNQNVNPGSRYYLLVEDNGNISVNRGSSPTDFQGQIWSSNTNTNSTSTANASNPNMTAAKGKYGKNWITNWNQELLSINDFVGSPTGSAALVLEPDGNLVLCAFEMTDNCSKISKISKISKTIYGGGEQAYGLYDLGATGVTANVGKLGYINANSQMNVLKNKNQITYTNQYTPFKGLSLTNTNSDTNADAEANTEANTVKACNANQDCIGYTLDTISNQCTLHTDADTNTNPLTFKTNENKTLFLRKPNIHDNVPVSISSIAYENYPHVQNNEFKTNVHITSVQKQQLSSLQDKMNLLMNEINQQTEKNKTQLNQNEWQMQNNALKEKTMFTKLQKPINLNLKQATTIANDTTISLTTQQYWFVFWVCVFILVLVCFFRFGV